eukprot:CAMPEP_0184861244 /NCGR_PEP_ID=MMETSP0580-20130426/5979_1 /TAXON_ID=1118495 /ORGANISM="Dactyliosolen fragilissimus" /LENGTH=406 /DNA_ID=CAMNT_0027358667 /DNA_START=293 /DNA_END=1511 /DNA_ORIENTATION=-
MSCPFTKRVMKVFSSLSEAGRETNISTIPIGKVCQVGGGIVEGRYFRYVNDNKEDIAKSHLEDTTNGQPLEIVHQLEKHESERVQSDKSKRTETSFRNDRNCRDDDESVQNSLISLQQESQKEVYTSQGKKSIPRKRKRVKNVDTLAKKKVHLVEDNPQEIPKDNMKSNSISEVQTNIGSQMVHRSVKYPDSSIQNTSTPSDAPEGCFDLTTLRPSTSLPSEKKKMVELICKGRSEVVVCFRGYSAAANALGLDRSQISLMCENNYEPSALQTYSLRLTSNKSPQSAYEYGCHDEDFVENSETYTERLERFRTTYELEVQSEYELANGTTEEVPIVSLGGTTTINPLTPVSLRNKNQLLNEKYQGNALYARHLEHKSSLNLVCTIFYASNAMKKACVKLFVHSVEW